MGVKWTKEQQSAIIEKGQNILVAAAAGSGKTAVLVERIICKIINDGVDIDKLLVVTFTNAAASEMRERVLEAIYKKLEDNPDDDNLQKQITLLNKSSICTIDSFCLEIVRNNFFELDGVAPNFRIGDKVEIDLLKQEIIEEIFEKKYEEKNEEFQKLIKTYTTYSDDTPLKDLVLKIYGYIQSDPFPEKWLKDKIKMYDLENTFEEDFSETVWGKYILEDVEEQLIDIIKTLKKIERELVLDPELDKYQKIVENDIERLIDVKNTIDNWDITCTKMDPKLFLDWRGPKVESDLKVYAQTVRTTVKEKYKEKIMPIFISNSKEIRTDIYEMYDVLINLEKLVLEFKKEFTKRKREKNVVDFNDVEHLALSLLIKKNKETGEIEKTEIAKRYKEKFEEIAIDEYQDSNLLQEYILTSVSRDNNIFMVGDVKQSIYKFRQAMPELFLNKYEVYNKKEEGNIEEGLKIQLFKNFRSKKNVLDFTNVIFQNIMSKEAGDIDYVEEEYLNLGASYEPISQDEKIEINVIDFSGNLEEEIIEEPENEEDDEENKNDEIDNTEEKVEAIEVEAKYVATRIKEMIDNKYQVWDRKKDSYRDIMYKDIVILLRATKVPAPVFEQELIDMGIPVFSDGSQEYLASREIELIMNLLRIIDNPMQDIPLVTVLRSNIGNFTDDELVEIRLTDKYTNFYTCLENSKSNVNKELKEKIDKFLTKLAVWRKEQEYYALDEFIWKLYSQTGLYNFVGLMNNGELRQANLKMLFERARNFESASFKGLYNFIKFIEKLKISSQDMDSAKIIGENDDVVRIMSIHKSKGLEFPVVFLSNTSKRFNFQDLKDNIILHQELGLGIKYIDYDKQITFDTLTKKAIKNKVRIETLSEEMRILYVALTRAKEKLIVTGISRDYQKAFDKFKEQIDIYSKEDGKINPIFVKKYITYLDWMLLVYYYDKFDMDKYTLLQIHNNEKVIKKAKKLVSKENKKEFNLRDLNKNTINKEELEKIEKMLNYEYTNKLSITIPTKSSVTKLKELMNKEQNILKDNQNTNKEQSQTNTIEITYKKPDFMKEQTKEELTGAQKGTLLHLCMQKLDINIEYTKELLKSMINSMVNENIISSVEAEGINIEKIFKFTNSSLWKDMKKAKLIYKEKPFYITIPAKEIYNQEIEENIIVQGIIDLFYIDENDNIILVDYKTDYIEHGKEKVFILKYKAQLDLYERALKDVYKKEVFKKVIYSTYLEKELEVE